MTESLDVYSISTGEKTRNDLKKIVVEYLAPTYVQLDLIPPRISLIVALIIPL